MKIPFKRIDLKVGKAYVTAQRHEGWTLVPDHYDDGGYSGGNIERPALKRLMADIRDNKIDVVVVYKIDRLTRSLLDFAHMIEVFEKHNVSFVSVTQQFNTTTSMGRLILNVLLSFAQFEREVTGERIRDKLAASKRKGMWMGGILIFDRIRGSVTAAAAVYTWEENNHISTTIKIDLRHNIA
jgi:DNA invertase Pin-like site-specific DNA recombinase